MLSINPKKDQTGLKKTGRLYNSHSIFSFANKELKNSEPTNSKKYYYNGLATNIIMNYNSGWDTSINIVSIYIYIYVCMSQRKRRRRI